MQQIGNPGTHAASRNIALSYRGIHDPQVAAMRAQGIDRTPRVIGIHHIAYTGNAFI